MSGRAIVLLGGILSSGLIAGFFYGWIVSAIPGLARVSDRTYVTSMQNINRAIINPAFVLIFMVPPAALAAAAFLYFRAGETRRAWLLVGATATYVVGVLAVTFGGNIPLNDALDTFDLDGATDAALAERRTTYETPWNRWHNLRTAASVAAFALAGATALVTADAE